MTTFQPGQIVTHPRLGNGIYSPLNGGCIITARPVDGYATLGKTVYDVRYDLTDWEPAEVVKPGHVQVRVDDLDLEFQYGGRDESEPWNDSGRLAIRAARALAAQQKPAQPAELPYQRDEVREDGGTTVVLSPTPEQPTSATVSLPCPDCGEAITDTVTVDIDEDGRFLSIADCHTHTCGPAQPDEPTSFGARVTVTRPDGEVEKWLRSEGGADFPKSWSRERSVTTYDWGEVIERGPISLGWGD